MNTVIETLLIGALMGSCIGLLVTSMTGHESLAVPLGITTMAIGILTGLYGAVMTVLAYTHDIEVLIMMAFIVFVLPGAVAGIMIARHRELMKTFQNDD